MAAHSNILAWEIPWTEEPGGLQPMGLQRIRHNWATECVYSLLEDVRVLERNKSRKAQRTGGRGRFTVSLLEEGLTEKVTFEKRFEEASHAYFWEKELSRQRNGKITFLLHFFFFSFLLNIADKIPLWSRLLRKLFWFFTSVFMYNKAQGAAYFKTIINICNKKWVFFLAIW